MKINIPIPEDYPSGSPEKAIANYLQNWKKGKGCKPYLQKSWWQSFDNWAAYLKNLNSDVLIRAKIGKRNVTNLNGDYLVDVEVEQTTQNEWGIRTTSIRLFRVIKEDGDWGVNPPSTLRTVKMKEVNK